jgi:hypothetical protein
LCKSCDEDEEKGDKFFHFSKTWSTSGLKPTGETEALGEKLVSVPF